MELDRNQPTGSGLPKALLAPWFDQPAAWLVLLGIGLTVFVCGHRLHSRRAPATDRPHSSPVSRRPLPPSWSPGAPRNSANSRPSAEVPGAGWRSRLSALLAATFAVPATRSFDLPALQFAAGLLQFAFFPCVAIAAVAMLLSTRGRSFGPQFWLEATLVALCVGTVLWLALPHELAPDVLPARGSWTVGLDAVIGVLAAILLLRRSDWQGWPGLVAFALALGALLGARLLEAHAAADGPQLAVLRSAAGLFAMATFAIAAHFDYLRTERRAPPMDAAERGSPFALAHALCRADARGLCAPDAAFGQLRRPGRSHCLGRLHRGGPPVRAPGHRDGARGRSPDGSCHAFGRGALQRADPQYGGRHRHRRRQMAGSATSRRPRSASSDSRRRT